MSDLTIPEPREVLRRVNMLIDEAKATLSDHNRIELELDGIVGVPVNFRLDDTQTELLVHVGLGPNTIGETFWWFAAPAARVGLHQLDDRELVYVPDGNEVW